ncbi:MAG: TolC family protein [Gammaproteobacteria bacterium]|nr:MAG: TolC family protein [Gammaproteobacteria bacterium]
MYNKNDYRRSRLGIALLWLAVICQPLMALEDDIPFANQASLTSIILVAAVLARNPDIPTMQATWQAAKARIEQANSFDDPMLSYSAAPRSAGADGLDFGQKFSLSQRLPWPGKRELRGDVARAEANAAFVDIEQARLKLTETAKTAYADWYFVHAAIRINGINKALLQEFQNIAEIKYSTGRASRQDALRAEVEQVLLEHRDIVLERQRRDVMADINTLLQRLPDQPLPRPAALPQTIPLPAVEQLRKLALEHHPELRALVARIQASRYRERLAKRNDYPDITLNAGYNTLWNQSEKRFTVGASINIPLQGKRRAAKDEARAMTLSLDSQQRAKVSQLMGEVQLAVEKVRETEHVLNLYQNRLLPLAEENLQAAQSDYEAGSGNFLDLIGAEKNLMQTRLQRERAWADYHRRLAALEHIVGRTLGTQFRGAHSGSKDL